MKALRIRKMQKSSTRYIEKTYKIKMLGYLNRYEISYLNKSLFQIQKTLFIKEKYRFQ